MKNAFHAVPGPKLPSSAVLLRLTNSLKPKEIQFVIIYDEEKHQNFTFQELHSSIFWRFGSKNVSQIVSVAVNTENTDAP